MSYYDFGEEQSAIEDEDEELRTNSMYFVIFAGMLALVLVLSKFLHEMPKINWFVSEASMILVIGLLTGFGVWIFVPHFDQQNEKYYVDGGDSGEYQVLHSLLSFSPNVFFMALLPPIIFNSGYQLRRELFYRHIQPIVMFACLGTTICALCTGFVLYGISTLGYIFGQQFTPSLLEFLTFGALIAATDTVSVLSILKAKKVDPHLFYLVFGESALNDAVALVLFNTFSDLLKTEFEDAQSIVQYVLRFSVTFMCFAIGSPVLGIFFGFVAALVFKIIDFRNYPNLELPLYMLLMYTPFVLAECFHLSGIVTIFFSGISARRYIAPNVSSETRHNAETIFGLVSYLAETCIFLELGLSVFGLPGSYNLPFIACAFLATLLGRALGIYPLAFLHNYSLKVVNNQVMSVHLTNLPAPEGLVTLSESTSSEKSDYSYTMKNKKKRKRTPPKRKDMQISWEMTHIIWFAGLRGAVAYACARKFPNLYGHADEFIAATMVIVLLSVIVMGGATEPLLNRLCIQMDVDEEDYMREWHKKRQLRGGFHQFEHDYLYKVVVRDANIGSTDDSVFRSFDDELSAGSGFDHSTASSPNSSPRRLGDEERVTTIPVVEIRDGL